MAQDDPAGGLPPDGEPRRGPARRQLLTTLGAIGLAAAGAGAARALGLSQPGHVPHAAAIRATATPPPPTATPDARPVSVVITGDVMLARTVNQQMLASRDQFPFNHTGDLLKSFDETVGNLECVVSRLGTPIPGKPFTFEADPIGFQRLQGAGFSLVSVANNHSGDYGKGAFTDMLHRLPDYGITPLGGGANRQQAHQAVYRRVHSTTLGFLAYCEIEPPDFAATDTTPGHAWLTADALKADIAATRPNCDFLITFMHWGYEGFLTENDDQRFFARTAIDAGADLVVGCHPHVIQPNEMYNGKLIVYSLGNFVFDYMTAPNFNECNVLTINVRGPQLLDWKLVHAVIGDWGQPAWG
jgi:poly-gamma-glutamate capsule biosynthesis protein CapA/YwtB (metallophosphatase superfamily)